jgi:hypothetical protein
MDDGADKVRIDVFLERGGMLTGTGRQHFHPNADEGSSSGRACCGS